MLFMMGFLSGVISAGDQVTEFNPKELQTLQVFKNNIFVLFSMLVVGTLTGSVYSLFVVFFNGMIVGETLFTVYNSVGIKPIISGFLPHAVFETLSILLVSAITCYPLLVLVRQKKNPIRFGKSFLEVTTILITAFLLCSLASIIEGNFSTF
ncbi:MULTISPECIES: stage II sporulation protein M [Exiguobacterium]|uniref:stage II sporulation protein M n=2 Tax=Bacillales Family XII. Incertae Sedis TaxID=539742 RepID=UPI0025B7DE58|nr:MULTISPECIES: stage II sporulation protein M [Exiguobacterium]